MIDGELLKEKKFGLDGFNMNRRSKRFQEEFDEKLNNLIKGREEETKLINFSQLLQYDLLFSFLIIF